MTARRASIRAATRLLLTRPGAVDKILITCEHRALPTPPYKTAAFKGYVNGSVKSLVAEGLKLTSKTIPDLETLDLSKRIVCRFTFEGGGKTFHVQHHTLLTDQGGYSILVIATSVAGCNKLAGWAKTLQPLTKR